MFQFVLDSLLYSVLFFGKSAWTDVSVHPENAFRRLCLHAYKHANRLTQQMESVCKQSMPNGIAVGKFIIDSRTTKFVCHFYEPEVYVKRVLFVENYPCIHYWFGPLLFRTECFRAVLTWRSEDLLATPRFEFFSSVHNSARRDELELLLRPIHPSEPIYLDEFIFG